MGDERRVSVATRETCVKDALETRRRGGGMLIAVARLASLPLVSHPSAPIFEVDDLL